MQKILTDEQLLEMGKIGHRMLQDATALWSTGMRTLRIDSTEYRGICAAGRTIQKAYASLRLEAETRAIANTDGAGFWTIDKLNELLPAEACGFD